MNYIYDVFINLYKYPIDFFEWDIKNIVNIIKTPLFKYKDINKIKYNYFKVDTSFLNKLKNKGSIKNSCILTNEKEALFLVFNDNGFVKYKSKLLFEEEDEVIKYCDLLDDTDIIINIDCKDNYNYFSTKKCNENKKEILKKINNISTSKMKYIYYEYFNEKSNDIDIIKKTLINNYEKIYNLL